MYKTIICAIEISKEATFVLSRAQDLAEKYGARLMVISVLPYTVLPKDYQKELTEKAIPKFNRIVDEFGVAKKNRMLKVGKPYEVICKVAEQKAADLVVIGTHSKKGLRSLVGSTATGVANYAGCDVSLVRI